MLMRWAGEIYDHLTIGDLYWDEALSSASGAADLSAVFQERKGKSNGSTRLVSLPDFEQRFGLRVRIDL